MRITGFYAFLFALLSLNGWSQSSVWCEQNGPVSGLPDSLQAEQSTVLTANSAYTAYQWNTGETSASITALFSGEYWVSITDDSSCVLVDTIVVSLLNAYTDSSFSAICEPQNVTLPLFANSGANTASAYFNSSASWLNGIANASFPVGSASRTFETWINHSGQSAEVTIFSYGDPVQNQEFRLTIDADDSLRLYAGLMQLVATETISPNTWHHIAVAVDSNGKYSFIIDFQMLNYDPLPAALNCGNGLNFSIGKSAASDPFSFQGYLDEIKLWSAFLSPFELETYTHFHCNSLAVPYDMIYFDLNQQIASNYYSINGLQLVANAVTSSAAVPFSAYQYLIYWQNNWISDPSALIMYVDQTQLMNILVSDGILQMAVQFDFVLVNDPDLQDEYMLCNADSVLISPAENYQQYSWSDGQTGNVASFTQSGLYSLSVSSYSCSYTDTFRVDFLSIDILQSDTAICFGESLQLNALTPENNYYWSTDQVSSSILVSPSASQIYTVQTANAYQTCTDSIQVEVLPLPQSMLLESYKVCNQSAVVLLASSDFSQNYLWNTGETNAGILASSDGWYEVTITNSAGCTILDSTEVTMYSIDIPQSNVIVCDSQPLDFTAIASGGLLWSNGSTTANIQVIPTQSISVWTVSLTDFPQCKDSVVVNLGGNFTVGLPDSLFSCGATSQQISANQLPVSYAWSNGSTASSITVTVSGLYSVILEDSLGCSVSDSTLVSLIFASIEQSADTVCEGEMVMLNAWAGPYNYLWSNGEVDPVIFVYPMETASFFISVNDGFQTCYFNTEIYVNQVATGPIQGELTIYAGDTVYLYTVDGAEDSEFQWLVSGGMIDSIQGDSIWIVWSFPGEAYIQVTEFASNGCTGIPVELFLDILNLDLHEDELVKLFPNPASDVLHLSSSQPFNRVQVFSMDGKCLLNEEWPGQSLQHSVQLKHLSKGIYLLYLDGKFPYQQKIIKQ